MKARTFAVVVAGLLHATLAMASWPLGFFGIVEKVVFEPDQANARRVQVWGAFSYTQPDSALRSVDVTPRAERGYLYFTIPEAAGDAERRAVRREWADLNAVAGTREAVGFGAWKSAGGFTRSGGPNAEAITFNPKAVNGQPSKLRVRPAAEAPSDPAPYVTNVGVVRLAADGSHALIVRQLRDALRR